MSNVVMRACGTCAAFGLQLDYDPVEDCDFDGACRKNPPQTLISKNEGWFITIFPPVNREDWCLSWTPKDGDEDV